MCLFCAKGYFFGTKSRFDFGFFVQTETKLFLIWNLILESKLIFIEDFAIDFKLELNWKIRKIVSGPKELN